MKNNCFINLFDINGNEFKINVSGKEKVKTFLGSIIGLISICAISAHIIFQLYNIISKNSTFIVYNESSSSIAINNFTNIPMMFKIADSKGNKINHEGLYSIQPYYISYIVDKESKEKSRGYTKVQPLEIEPCQREKHLGEYSDLFKNFDVEEYYCIPTGKYNLTIFSSFGDLVNGFSQISVFVTKCSNQSCLEENIAMKKLTEVLFVFAHVGYQVDNFNYLKPTQKKVVTITTTFTYDILKRWIFSYMPMSYDTDYGFFLENINQENYFLLSNIFMDVSLKPAMMLNPNPQYASFNIRNTENSGKYFRSYVKLSSVISSSKSLYS